MPLTELPEHFQQDFADNWEHLLQQKESRLEGTVRMERNIKGDKRTFSQLGKGKMRKITTRNGKTVPSDSPMAKRWLRLVGYDEVTHIDEFDDVALGKLPTPESEHVQQHRMAWKRQIDEVILEAAEGTAYIGKQGTTEVDVPATQKVAVNYVRTGTTINSGLTLAKILRALHILNANEVEPDEPKYLVHAQQQLTDLLNDVEEVKSRDYNTVAALVDGRVSYYGGFNFIRTELTTLDTGTDVRTCPSYCRSGIACGYGRDRSVRITIRDDLNETVQVRTKGMIGATRLEEEKVVLIYCDESP